MKQGPLPKTPKAIERYVQYRACMFQLRRLLAINPDPDPKTHTGKRVLQLVELIEGYEKKHYPFRKPSDRELRKFREAERTA